MFTFKKRTLFKSPESGFHYAIVKFGLVSRLVTNNGEVCVVTHTEGILAQWLFFATAGGYYENFNYKEKVLKSLSQFHY